MNPHLLEAIAETPLFDGLSPDRAARAARAFCLRSYDRGDTISGAADAEPRTYVMVSGVARSVRVNDDGRCLTSGLLDAGSIFGRLPYVEDDWTDQTEALVDCRVLRAATADLEALAGVEPVVARSLVRSSGARLRSAETRLAGLAFQPVPARLAGVVIDLADHFGKVTREGVRIDVALTHGALAEMVGTTRETLTKISGWLRSEDIATIERRVIRVHHWDALEELQHGTRCMPGRTSRVGAEL